MRTIVKYRKGDFATIKPRRDFSALLDDDGFDGEPSLALSWSLVGEDSVAVACGGVVRERRGVYTLWGYCTDALTRRDWLTVASKVRLIIATLMAEGAHRIQALAAADSAAAVKYLMHLGLKQDMNRLVAYGPDGEDYVLLAHIKGVGA